MTLKTIKNIILFLFITSSTFAQTITIVSSTQHQPLPKARIDIHLQQKSFHFRTNLKGEWELNPEFRNQPLTLKISFFGYQTKIVKDKVIGKDITIALATKVKRLKEVAITAQYGKKLVQNAVHNIKIIDQKQIEAMGAQTVEDALKNELNVHFTRDNILGSGIQLQGIGGENVKILMDGVPLTGRLNGSIDLSQIPVENIKRIEIVEGPLSVSYGTDALAGTINIITKKNQAKNFVASTNNYFESSGKMNNSVALGFKLGEHQIRINGGRHFFDGWDPSQATFNFQRPMADSSRYQFFKPKIQYFGGLNYRWKGKRATFDYSGQIMDEKIINRGYPRAPYQTMAFDRYYNTQRLTQRLSYQYRFKNEYRLSLMAGYSGYYRQENTKVRDLTTITDVPSGNPDDHDTSNYHSISARGRLIQAKTNKKIHFEVGFDVLYEMALGQKIMDRRQDIGDYALFATAEYSPISSLTIRPGLRYGYNTNYTAPLTPSINVRYKFWEGARQDLTVRASYARGFRSPTIKELYYTFVDANHNIVGNENIDAETSNNYNLSLHQNLRWNKVQMQNQISFFYNDIKNQITLARATAAEYTYFNLNQYVTTGVQLESKIYYKNLSVGIGGGYIGRYNKIHSSDNFKMNKFLFSPQVNMNIMYNWRQPGLQFALFYKYSGVLPQVVSDENGKYRLETLEDFHLANFKISKSLWKDRLQVSVGVKNIFDVTTIEGSEGAVISAHSSGSGTIAVGMGRTYNVGVKFNINTNWNEK